jgi:hypothetical protein
MQALALAHREDFDAALAAGRAVGQDGQLPGLAAPLGAGALGHVSEAWDHIEATLEQAWNRGRAFVRDTAVATAARVQEIVEAAGAAARAVHHGILEKLDSYLSALIDRALARVRPSVTVGGRTLELDSVELEQTVTLSGSLKVSIEEVCALTAEGEIALTAHYGA